MSVSAASILDDIEALPHGLLFWRSMTQWIGGMGIVIFTIAVLPIFGVGGIQLFAAEATGPKFDKITPRIDVTAKWIWTIYIGLTGCQGKKEDNVIKIGAILPLTGYAAFNGQTCKEGLELALSEIDSIKTNYKFDFRCEDSKSSVKDAQMAYKKLRSFGTNYFVAFGGQFLLGFAPETNNQDVVLFAEGTPNMNILSLTNRCFRVYPNVEMVTDK